MATMICRRTGRYSRIIRRLGCGAAALFYRRERVWNMAVWRRDRARQGGRQPFVFLASLLYGPACDQVLQLLVSTQPKHFLASAGSIPRPQIFMDDIEEFLELERGAAGKHRYQFLRNQVRNSTGECVFLENSHKAKKVAYFCPTNSTILAPWAP